MTTNHPRGLLRSTDPRGRHARHGSALTTLASVTRVTTDRPQVSSDPPHQTQPRRVLPLALVAAAGMSTVAVQFTMISTWIRYYVNEDQALMWAAARSWGRGIPHQPHFWGQTYGTTIEAIPAELLRRLGIGLATSLPISIVMFNFAGWAAMAWAARHRAKLGLLVIALGIPALLPSDYLVLSVAYNTAAGRTIAAISAACVLARHRSTWRPYLAIGVGAVALLIDNSTILLVAPVGLYAGREILADGLPWLRRLRYLVSVGIPAMVWQGFITWWYAAHPNQNLHPSPRFEPSMTRLSDHLGGISEFLATYSSQVWRSPVVPLVVMATLVVVSARSHQWLRVAAVGTIGVLVLVILSVPRSGDWLPTAYYPAARILLPLPMAVWFLYAIEPLGIRGPTHRGGSRLSPTQCAGVAVALTVAMAGRRLVQWGHDVVPLRNAAVEYPNYPLTEVAALTARCRTVAATATAAGADFVAFDGRTAAYACEALIPDLKTVYPPYERRTWMLDEFLSPATRSFLIDSPTAPTCTDPRLRCEVLGDQLTLVTRSDDISGRDAWLSLGYPLRPGY